MGRWQSDYHDEVLCLKFKSLVQGAIARSKLEKSDSPAAPMISYETLVQSLDHGDSFTTSLVEILVKELAERQTRQNSSDRHLIAERTVKSLQKLSTINPYRSRRPFHEFYVARGAGPLDWEMLTQNADEEDVDVEDAVAPGSPHRAASDSLRVIGDQEPMYPFPPETTIRRSFPVQTQSVDPETDEEGLPIVGYPTRRSPPAVAPSAQHPTIIRHGSLMRQASLRRPARSRTSDFNEFTTRRRSTGRHEQGSQAGGGPEVTIARASELNNSGGAASGSGSGSGEFSSSMDIANLLHNHHHTARGGGNSGAEIDSAMPVASFASSRRYLARIRSSEDRGGESGSGSSESPLPSPRLFMLHTTGSSTGPAPASSRLTVNAPRLRRGGVRAPEQFPTSATVDGYTHSVRISSPPFPPAGSNANQQQEEGPRSATTRRSSSAEMEYIIQAAPERFGSRSPRSRSPLSVWGGTWHGYGNTNPTSSGSATRDLPVQESAGTPANLPTPRSISPEGPAAARQA